MQTDKLSKKIGVILYGREYWDQVLRLEPMAEWGAIAEKDLELLHYADTPSDAFDQLRDHLIDASPRARSRRKPRRRASRRRAVNRSRSARLQPSVSYCVDAACASAIVAQPVAHALIH